MSKIIFILILTFSLSVWANETGAVSKTFVINKSFSELVPSGAKLFLEINYPDRLPEKISINPYEGEKYSLKIEIENLPYLVVLVLETEEKNEYLIFKDNSDDKAEIIDITPIF